MAFSSSYYYIENPFQPPRFRTLFEAEYIEAGCEGPFPEGTDVDDTIGTWSTNYAIGAAGLVGSIILFVQIGGGIAAASSNVCQYRRLALISHLVLHCIGFVLAGVGHQVVKNKDETENGYWIGLVSLAHVSWSLPWLVLGLTPSDNVLLHRTNAILLGGFLLGVAVLLAGLRGTGGDYYIVLLLVGVLYGLIQLGLLLHAGYILVTTRHTELGPSSLDRASFLSWIPALIIGIAGLLLQATLAPVCGVAAYEDCFEDCPLPYDMGHNFLYHVLQFLSIILIIVGGLVLPKEDRKQTVVEDQEGQENSDDDSTGVV